jgi:UDP-N-acetylmuramate--alanine ligase
MTGVFSSVFKPTAFIGGESISYGNLLLGEKDFCITEACEYKKNLLNINPTVSVLLNADYDHVDCFKDVNDVAKTFDKFKDGTICIKNADDENLKNIKANYTFGIKNPANFLAKRIKTTCNGASFWLYVNQKRACKISIPLYGKHNVLNTLAVIATAINFNLPLSKIKTALLNFKGVKRRNEFLGKKDNTLYFADYAHHPNEIKTTLDLYKFKNNSTLFVFEPHTYTRTKVLMNDFVEVFKKAKHVVIYKTYPAREVFDPLGDAKTLADNVNLHKKRHPVAYLDDIFKLFLYTQNFDKVVILGAGKLYDEVVRILK